MYRRSKHNNFNRNFLYGIFAMAFVVIGVVATFFTWSIRNRKDDLQEKKSHFIYQVTFDTSFVGDSIYLYANYEHLLYKGIIPTSFEKVMLTCEKPIDVLTVESPQKNETTHLNIEKKEGSLQLKRVNNLVTVSEIDENK